MSAVAGRLLGPRGLDRMWLVGLAAGFLACDATWAAGVPVAPAVANRNAERVTIDAERRRVEASFVVAHAACQGRFLLTQCLDQARTTRRLALDDLQRRQLTLDDAARRERSAQRLETLQARASELGRAASTPAPTAAPSPTAASSATSPGLPVPQVQRPVLKQRTVAPDLPGAAASAATVPRPPAAAASVQSQRNRAAYLQRQQQAAAHRDAVLGRNARQDAGKPPAASLPVPAAAPVSH